MTTLKRFLNERTLPEQATMLLVQATDHYISAHLDWACDNWTGKPVPISQFPKLGRWVEDSWLIRKLPA